MVLDPASIAALVEACLLVVAAILGRNELQRRLQPLSAALSKLSSKPPRLPADGPPPSKGQ